MPTLQSFARAPDRARAIVCRGAAGARPPPVLPPRRPRSRARPRPARIEDRAIVRTQDVYVFMCVPRISSWYTFEKPLVCVRNDRTHRYRPLAGATSSSSDASTLRRYRTRTAAARAVVGGTAVRFCVRSRPNPYIVSSVPRTARPLGSIDPPRDRSASHTYDIAARHTVCHTPRRAEQPQTPTRQDAVPCRAARRARSPTGRPIAARHTATLMRRDLRLPRPPSRVGRPRLATGTATLRPVRPPEQAFAPLRLETRLPGDIHNEREHKRQTPLHSRLVRRAAVARPMHARRAGTRSAQ